MLLGLVVFVIGKPLLAGRGEAPNPARLTERVAGGLKLEWLLYCSASPPSAASGLLIQYQGFYGWLLLISGSRCWLRALRGFKLEPKAARADVRDPLPDRATTRSSGACSSRPAAR